jgi:Leucine-rich repeat (LRR) protein
MSLRGTRTLFSDIFITEPEPATKQRKGRSESLFLQRNELLIDRYYYYGKLTDKRYNVIIKTLSQEFFLSTETIPEILTHNYIKLSLVKREQPTKRELQKKWPWLVW